MMIHAHCYFTVMFTALHAHDEIHAHCGICLQHFMHDARHIHWYFTVMFTTLPVHDEIHAHCGMSL